MGRFVSYFVLRRWFVGVGELRLVIGPDGQISISKFFSLLPYYLPR
jgi:hypothetical protein